MNIPGLGRRKRGKAYPVRCPTDGTILPPPIPQHVLEAGRALRSLPGGVGTPIDIVAAGVTARRTRAAELLRQAAIAGLLADIGWTVTPSGQRAKRYRVVSAMLGAYDPVTQP